MGSMVISMSDKGAFRTVKTTREEVKTSIDKTRISESLLRDIRAFLSERTPDVDLTELIADKR